MTEHSPAPLQVQPRWMQNMRRMLAYELLFTLLALFGYLVFSAILADGSHPVEFVDRYAPLAQAGSLVAAVVAVKLLTLTVIAYMTASIFALLSATIMPNRNTGSGD